MLRYNVDMSKQRFVVVEPLTFTGADSSGFTYSADSDLEIGQIVKVPLGRQQSLGVVANAHVAKPNFATKPVAETLDLKPLPAQLVGLAEWMKSYYYASPKAVWQTMLPAGITRKRRVTKEADTTTLAKQNQPLNPAQQEAFDRIISGNETSYLVQGVTGSGKTRLYLELASESLKRGRSVIILVPEIALTPQLIALFEASFKGQVVPYHSVLTEAQKHLAWQRALDSNKPMVVVGPRSSLFLPLESIGLIVVDECHESSYKQEQNPRYHAVPTAAKLAQLSGAKLVLGSATPGLNEVYLTEIGRVPLIKLPERIEGRKLPEITIVDLRDRAVRGPNAFISTKLLAALTETLEHGRQSLLFLNRRGTASSHLCDNCGHVSVCPTCHLPLTFHADTMQLVCHICNYHVAPPAVCPECGSSERSFLGGGTKRIEEEIIKLLPNARLLRLDKDSADPKTMPELYKQLHDGKVDILIGTQMIAKGLDLPGLDTVGVINADSMLHLPDFGAAERTFGLLMQVSGRAGRSEVPGRVFIQTRTPDHPAIQLAAKSDFWGFARKELAERQTFGYPPFRFLLKLTVSASSQMKAIGDATDLYDKLKSRSDIKILGPAPAFHERAGGTYHWQLMIKAASRGALVDIARSVPPKWRTDLDPINLL
jgi:primosomal protein N' (replication factor Y) (superfamily II helicase)